MKKIRNAWEKDRKIGVRFIETKNCIQRTIKSHKSKDRKSCTRFSFEYCILSNKFCLMNKKNRNFRLPKNCVTISNEAAHKRVWDGCITWTINEIKFKDESNLHKISVFHNSTNVLMLFETLLWPSKNVSHIVEKQKKLFLLSSSFASSLALLPLSTPIKSNFSCLNVPQQDTTMKLPST